MADSPLVLILTHSDDHFTVDRVAAALERRGARSFRLDTDQFPSRVLLSARLGPGGNGHTIDADGATVDARSVHAVWSRRVWTPRLPDDLDERFRAGCEREASAALHGFLDAAREALWVNRWDADRRAEDKALQLRVARSLGLSVPRTLVTNDAARVRAFFDEVDGAMIAKMLTPLSVSMGRAPFFVRTSVVSAADLEDAESLRHSPMVFQELVPKARELRVACVGERQFVGAIDASRSKAGRVDWRGAATGEARWEHAELLEETADGLRALCDELGLVYGAVDLIVKPDGEHVFLEINPGGEWGMLERDLKLPISQAIADALLGAGTTAT